VFKPFCERLCLASGRILQNKPFANAISPQSLSEEKQLAVAAAEREHLLSLQLRAGFLDGDQHFDNMNRDSHCQCFQLKLKPPN
jgi:hypothetical protein